MDNKTNAEISYCQTAIQEFRRRMKGRFLVKGNKDKNAPGGGGGGGGVLPYMGYIGMCRPIGYGF